MPVVGAVVVTAGLPSPKLKRYEAIGVASVSVEPEASASTVRGGELAGVTESAPVGGTSPDVPRLYSTWSKAACVGRPPYEYAVRCPTPLTMTASAFPLAPPLRVTTSWNGPGRFGQG